MSATARIETRREGEKTQIRAPGNGRVLSKIRVLVSDLARQLGFPEPAVEEIQMAVDEACSNIVQHAYSPDRKKEWFWQHRDPEIRMELHGTTDRLEIIIRDHGCRFDFTAYQPESITDRLRAMAPNGYGIAIMHALMDEVQYGADPDQGNTLRLVKLLKKS